jgi:hypothetical protein
MQRLRSSETGISGSPSILFWPRSITPGTT